MNYRQAVQFLHSLSVIERGGPPNLKRLQALLDILGNPERAIPRYLHVAGTSGKGSVCSYLHSIWSAAGQKTGLFLSPYITDIRERWQINHTKISPIDFINLVQQIKNALEIYLKGGKAESLSAFEIFTAMSFVYFAQKKVDCAVLEVGMGGKNDPTNIIKYKDAAIITDIGFDHTKYLGETITEIAQHKAGIITENTPVFTITTNKQAYTIIKKISTQKKVCLTQSKLSATEKKAIFISETGTRFKYRNNNYVIKAPGIHQVRNAILAIDVATHFGISNANIKNGLHAATQPIRCELVQRKPYIILDGAHNQQKISSTVETIKILQKKIPRRKIHLVLGFSGDKKTGPMIKKLLTLKPTSVACTKNTSNLFRKTLNPGAMLRLVKHHWPPARTELFLNPTEALAWSKKQAGKHDLILITGSIFLSGELRPYLIKNTHN